MYLIQLDDVRMSNQFQDMDLPLNTFHISNLDDSILLQYFDGNLLPRQLMNTHFHLAEGALTESLTSKSNTRITDQVVSDHA